MKLPSRESKSTMDESSAFGKRQYQSLVLLLTLYITATQFLVLQDYSLPYNDFATTAANTTVNATQTRLGDGCYHVFLDVGANVGVHGRFLLEPLKYPKTKKSGDLFKKEYALQDNRNVCVFEFEANSRHWPRLDEISEAYAKMGWRYHVIHAAVSDRDGSATFFHQGGRYEARHNEWGFSGAKDFEIDGGFEVTVPTIRLAEWINFHIHERFVPEVLGAWDKPKPVVGMKMDIEGYEMVVLPDLIHSGAICGFDFAFGEFHPDFAPIRQFRKNFFNGTNDSSNTTVKDHRVSLETKVEIKQYRDALIQVMHASRNCDIRWMDIDDESYLKDGQPLPIANDTSVTGTRLRGR